MRKILVFAAGVLGLSLIQPPIAKAMTYKDPICSGNMLAERIAKADAVVIGQFIEYTTSPNDTVQGPGRYKVIYSPKGNIPADSEIVVTIPRMTKDGSFIAGLSPAKSNDINVLLLRKGSDGSYSLWGCVSKFMAESSSLEDRTIRVILDNILYAGE